jgi:glucoamylase
MRLTPLTSVASVLWTGYLTLASPTSKSADLASYILKEGQRSVLGITENLGGKGSKAPGTAAGLFIASPNTANPDCKSQPASISRLNISDLYYQTITPGLVIQH